jgi:hypothetical protein
MKKARVMLCALTVIAVLGSALSFKAHTNRSNILYTGTTSTDCTHKVEGVVFTTFSPEPIYVSTTSTTSCDKFYITFVND